MRDLPRSPWLGLVVGFVLAGCSRNSSGTYSLPAGNPVVAGTTISSTTHNNTNSDLATELTDSLSRSGKGAMLAALQCYDGTVTAPGLTFATDTDSGLYRIGANNLGLALNGAKVVDYATTGIGVTGTIGAATGAVGAPAFTFTSDTDSGLYRIGANNVGLALGGAKVVDYATTGVAVTGTLSATGVAQFGNGVAGAPGMSFLSDTDTGIYRVAADDIALSAGSIKVLDCGVSCSMPVGLTVTQQAGDAVAITATGTDSGAGIVTTGGDTGSGIIATGGAISGTGGVFTGTGDGFGVNGTGSGTGYGVVGTGGPTGVGGAFIGGASGAIGVTGAGTGTSAGASFSNGTNATGGTRQDAVTLTNGDLDMSGVAYPTSTTTVTNRLTPANIAKAWGFLATNGAGAVSVSDGFNINSVAISGTEVVVTLTTAMANATFAVVSNMVPTAADIAGGGTSLLSARSLSASGGTGGRAKFTLRASKDSGTAIDLSAVSASLMFVVYGKQ